MLYVEPTLLQLFNTYTPAALPSLISAIWRAIPYFVSLHNYPGGLQELGDSLCQTVPSHIK